MDEREMKEFSWPVLFLVTSFCFFLFSGILKFLHSGHIKYFLTGGIITLFLGGLCWLGKILAGSGSSRTKKVTR